jgi:small-conductance mechanosensitive channel
MFQKIINYAYQVIDSNAALKTAVVIIVFVLLKLISVKITNNIIKKLQFDKQRKIIVSRSINLLLYVVLIISILGIYGVKSSDFIVYITSALTVLGVAFFAQWSHLSNITAGLIMFFSHPVKLGDHIKIEDKENPIDGKIENIGLFFMIIEKDNGDKLTIANTLFLQKTISIK